MASEKARKIASEIMDSHWGRSGGWTPTTSQMFPQIAAALDAFAAEAVRKRELEIAQTLSKAWGEITAAIVAEIEARGRAT